MGMYMRRLRLLGLSLMMAMVVTVLVGVLLSQASTPQVEADAENVYVEPGGDDDATCGDVLSPCQTIQYAVAQIANDGDTVIVAAGTYTEQVEITKTLTLKGEGSGTVIKSPIELQEAFTTSAANYPIVYVHAVDAVTIQDLVVDGAGRGVLNHMFEGVSFHNAGGTVDNVEIRDVREEPLSGTGHGVALYVHNEDGVSRVITVSNSIFVGFQKNALALTASDTTPLTVDIHGNHIEGAGVLTYDDGDPVQNGIQISASQGTGTFADNTIRDLAYDNTNDPTGYVASSILNINADVNVTGNSIADGQVGLYTIGGGAQVRDNVFEIDKAGVAGFGIIARVEEGEADTSDTAGMGSYGRDVSGVVPAPFGQASGRTQSLFAVNLGADTVDLTISDNTIAFTGDTVSDTRGIEAYAGDGPDDMDLRIGGNTVTGFDVGIRAWTCESDRDTGEFSHVKANHNRIYGNRIGLASNVDYLLVDAMDNWWGCNGGPSHDHCDPVTGTGTIDVSPWLILEMEADPSLLVVSTTSTITADLTHNSSGLDTSALGHIPDGVTTRFAATLGTVTPAMTGTVDGVATSIFAAGLVPGTAVISASVDNETVTRTVTVDQVVLTIEKTDGADVARAGDVLTYTVTIVNDSALDATGIVVTDTLPVSTTYVGGLGWHQVGDSPVYTQSVGALGARDSTVLSISVRLTETVPADFGPLTNTVRVSDDGSHGPQAFASDQDVNAVVVPPDLMITKENGVESTSPGQVLTYTLTVRNVGRQDATGVVVTDSLPTQSQLMTATHLFSSSNGTVTWAPFDLSAGGVTTRALTVSLADPPWPAGVEVITNTAIAIDDGTYGADLNVTDNEAVDVDAVDANPDLVIFKNDGEGSAMLGEVTSYVLSYVNQGDQVAEGVMISETVPGETMFEQDASTPGWQQVDTTDTYTLSVGTLEPGSGDVAIFAVRVNDTLSAGVTTIENVATIEDDGTSGPDLRPGNNRAADINAVSGAPDLAVSKDNSRTSVKPSDVVTYTLNVSNVGTQGATGVILSDTLPIHTTFVTASHGADLSAGVVTWPAFPLAAPGSTTRTVTVKVPAIIPAGVEVITNTASVTDDGTNGDDLVVQNNSAEDVDGVEAAPLLALVKGNGRSQVEPGEFLTYTLTVKNLGNQDAAALVMTDTLPAHTRFVAVSEGGVASDGVVVWTGLALAVGAQLERTVTVQVDEMVPGDVETIVNRAEVMDPEGVYDSAEDEDSLVTAPDLVLAKEDGEESVVAAQRVTYTLTITNEGTAAATGVVVSDTLPTAMVFVAASDGGAQTGPSSGVVSWPVFGLEVGEAVTRTVTVEVVDAVPAGVEVLTNTAVVADDGAHGPDQDPSDNIAEDVNVVDATPDLRVTKTDGRDVVRRGEFLTYTLTISNVGTQDATGVVVTDTLPAHTRFVGASEGGVASEGVVVWTGLALSVGAQLERTVTVQVDEVVPGDVDTIVNRAEVMDTEGAYDSAEDEDSLMTAPDLVLAKDDGEESVAAGQRVTYTLTITNEGTAAGTGVVVSDTLPTATVFIGASDGGAQTGPSSGVVSWPAFGLEVGEAVTRTVTVEVVDGVPAGVEVLTNTAVVADDGAHGPDQEPSNNVAEDVDLVDATPDLRVTKTDGRDVVRPGEFLTYTLTTGNVGTQGASGVMLSDTLPIGVRFEDASGGGSEDDGIVTWPTFDLAVEATEIRTLTVEVIRPWPSGIGNVLTNTVCVADDGANGIDPVPRDNTAMDITRVRPHAIYLPLISKQ